MVSHPLGSWLLILGRTPGARSSMVEKVAKSDSAGPLHTSPPGERPYDPVQKEIDPIGFALSRVQTFLVWIEEHRAALEKLRQIDPEDAERELSNLRDSTVQGMIYLQRLSELILGGCTIDPNKGLPESRTRGGFSFYLERLRGTDPESQGGEQPTST